MNGDQIKGYFTGEFWKINVGHVLAIAVFLAGLLISYGSFSAKFDNLSQWHDGIDKRLDKMDTNGTNYSHNTLDLERQILGSHEARLNKTEEVIGKIGVMSEKIDRITDDVKDLKQRR